MNLLIVDDELYAIQGILEGVRWDLLGFKEIFTAKSYTHAIDILQTYRIDIMLSDIEMPDESGLELIAWSNIHSPETECIILSCHDEFDFARRAISLKCLDYVLKPVPYELLTEVLRKAVDVVKAKHKQTALENYGKVYVHNLAEKSIGDKEKDDIVDIVTKYISSHISDNMSVEGLAGMVYVGPDHLTRSFKKRFNLTVSDYIMQQRMLMAGELLEKTNMSVTMVSAEVGYGNYSYFIKLFRKFFGKSPREYQQDKISKKEDKCFDDNNKNSI